MCDDKFLYLAIDLQGNDLDDAAMNLLIDPDNSKGSSGELIIQLIDYSFKDNNMKYSNSKVTTAAVRTENGYTFEAALSLELLEYEPVYLDCIGMEIEMFVKKGDYSKPRLFWSHSTDDSIWGSTTGYGTILLNNVKISGDTNSPPEGNQIACYSIAEGTSLSGKITVADPDGDVLTFRMDPNNQIPSETKATFELDSQTGEWSFTPSKNAQLANTILNYYIEADDGKGATFHQRIEIRVEYAPTNITYHVDGDNGNDLNDGLSHENAFSTIQKAANIVRPGDTVIIHETDTPYCYQEKQELIFSNSGLPDAYITFKAADGEQPVINANANWNTLRITGSYIVIDGLTIEGLGKDFLDDMAENYEYYQQCADGNGMNSNVTKFNTNGISFSQESGKAPSDLGIDRVKVIHHVTVRNCVVNYLGGAGIGGAGCDYITLENNTITNCCWGDMWACSAISVLGCIDIDDNTDEHKIIVRNNITAGNRHFVPWIRINKFSDGNGIIIDSTKNENTHRALLEKGDK